MMDHVNSLCRPASWTTCVCAALCLLVCILCTGAARTFAMPPGAEDELETEVREAHIPVFAVAITDPEVIVYERVFGDGADADTPFLLGSLSKSFTALGILQLEDQGKLSLDDVVRQYVPEAAPSVTIRQLMNHTSGYGTYQTNLAETPSGVSGEHVYSNLNYALLGCVIETVSGKTYEAYLQENILEPLEMERTSSDPDITRKNGLARQYENWFGAAVPAEAHFPGPNNWIQPSAGYISSSLNDMARYLRMYLRGGDGIVSSTERLFSETVYVESEIPYEYGLGWTVMREPLPETVYRHAGEVETSMTCMYLLPERQLGIVMLADMNDYLVGTDLLDRIGWNLVLQILEEEPQPIPAGEYWTRHGTLDGIYAAIIASAALPLALLGRFRRRVREGRSAGACMFTVLVCATLPTLLLLAPRLFLETPLWVVAAFVPDLHLVLWTAAGLLYAGGICRSIILRRAQRCRAAA